MTHQAPAGGIVSSVNGQFYKGGEFTPEHGLFCGKKGAARKTKWEKFAAIGRTVDLGGTNFYEVCSGGSGGVWYTIGCVIANTEKEARSAFVGATSVKKI